mmetsp:Transcript_19504/g.34794  ORF Transcript_19504/g.34794 Transcript_19504/m.34794 type:complete len:230 (-) Transcript_19504:198-887(-)
MGRYVILPTAMLLLLFVSSPAVHAIRSLHQSSSDEAGGMLFIIKSTLDGECLLFSGRGNDVYPKKYNWNHGANFCGFGEKDGMSPKERVVANKQAVWRLEQLEGDMYTIKSTLDEECLIFGANGNNVYPSRHLWGHGGKYCGFPEQNGMSSKESLLANKQAVWQIENLEDDKFVIKSVLDGKCLVFGGDDNNKYRSRFEWGDGGEFCGKPSKEAILAEKRAVFELKLMA